MSDRLAESLTTRRRVIQTSGAAGLASLVSSTSPAGATQDDQDSTSEGPAIEFVTMGNHSGEFGKFTKTTDIENRPGSAYDLIFRVSDVDHGGVVRAQTLTAIRENAEKAVRTRHDNYLERTVQAGRAFEFWREIQTTGWPDGVYTAVVAVVDFLDGTATTATTSFSVD